MPFASSAPPIVVIPENAALPFVNIEAATPAEPFDPTDNPPFAVTIPAAASLPFANAVTPVPTDNDSVTKAVSSTSNTSI